MSLPAFTHSRLNDSDIEPRVGGIEGRIEGRAGDPDCEQRRSTAGRGSVIGQTKGFRFISFLQHIARGNGAA